MTANMTTDARSLRKKAIAFYVVAMLCGFCAFASLFLGKIASISIGTTVICLILFFICFDKGWTLWGKASASEAGSGAT